MTGPPRISFRFERFWLIDDTEQIVQHIWNLSNMPVNNTKRLLTRLKLLRIELTRRSQQKFKGQRPHLTIAKWTVQTLDRVEEH
jgi:hypothetical protein